MQNRGFSLVELAIVTMIIGILMVPLLNLYKVSSSGTRIRDTEKNLQLTSEALVEFAGNNERYPCPASLIIAPGQLNYGEPDCRDGNGYSGFTQPTTIGDCFAGICRVAGRDVDGDGTGDSVLIGAVPYNIMNNGGAGNPPLLPASTANSELLPGNTTFDGWGNRLTYAVTEALTNSATYNPYSGGISVEDENGLSLLELPGTVHFVLISHGDDGVGAYTRNGTLVSNCNNGALDGQNCQRANATYVSALRSLASGPDYYDDMVRYISYTASTIWENVGQDAIFNAPGGKVAIGQEDAFAKLDVNGNIQAVQIHTQRFCGQGGSAANECYTPSVIAGEEPLMQCPEGSLMTAIKYGRAVCEAVPPANMNSTCAAGQVVVGISNLGNVKCCVLSSAGVLQNCN
jgi:prepilin-type N-terminal cleavage/methylation domain-containing protein